MGGSDGNSSSSAPPPAVVTLSTASPGGSGKRSRDPEDEVYVDNLNSHKRYLSEIMASSLNGLTVGDSLHENLIESPGRSEKSENMLYFRDETSSQYSPMSEDSDDSRYYENSLSNCLPQPESVQTSPVSPYRCQRSLSGLASSPPTPSHPSHSGIASSITPSQSRQRGSDTEGRFPSSPSDICHSGDLRRTALLRSVQMRAQPTSPSPCELPYSQGQEPGHNIETEEHPCSYMKDLVDEREYQIADCSSLSLSEHENREKSCRTLIMSLKDDESAD